MLFDLQALYVVVRHGQAERGQNGQSTHAGLRRQRASKRSPADHQGSDVRQDAQQDHDVAVDPVEQERLEPDDGHELPDHEEAHGQGTGQVDGDAYAVVAILVPVPLEWGGLVGELAGHVQVLRPCEEEAEHCSREDDDCPPLLESCSETRERMLRRTHREGNCSPFETRVDCIPSA